MTAELAPAPPPTWEAVLDDPGPVDPAVYAPTVSHDVSDPRFYNIPARGSHAAGIRVSWEAGSLREPAAGKGLHACVANLLLLQRDTRGHTVGERLEQLGAEVSAGATHVSTYLDICCSSTVVDQVMAA